MPANTWYHAEDPLEKRHNHAMTSHFMMIRKTVHHLSMQNGSFLLSIMIVLTGLPSFALAQEEAPRTFAKDLVEAAIERTHHDVQYDGSYRVIPYPMGDVPDDVGVCTDVVIRAYRTLGIDLQQLVHEDMLGHFSAYPKHWGLHKPDANIDHRRVPNLQTFLTRHGTVLPVTSMGADYKAGDLVTWTVSHHLPHIGIVTDHLVPGTDRAMIVHNIGGGPTLEDMLFAFPITGHFRYEHTRGTTPTRPNH